MAKKPVPQPKGPKWLDIARKYIGTKETPGKKHNTTILRWWSLMRAPFTDDETAWCGAFVGGVLAEAGQKGLGPKGASARAWLDYGNRLKAPAYGCIVVFWRGSKNGWSGHVGFVVGRDHAGNLMVLGGNQKNMVRIDPFDQDRVLGFIWPGSIPLGERYDLPILTSDGKLSTNEA